MGAVSQLRLGRRKADVQTVSSLRSLLAVTVVLATVALGAARHGHAGAARVAGGPPPITAHARAAGLGFDSAVAPADRQLVLHEIALARPEARRLIGIVDGLVTIAVGPATAGGAD